MNAEMRHVALASARVPPRETNLPEVRVSETLTREKKEKVRSGKRRNQQKKTENDEKLYPDLG